MRKSYWLLDTRLTVLASAEETGGRYDLVEGWFPVAAQVPLHRHGKYSEQLYVLEGEFTISTSGRKAILRPGDDVAIPAGTAHALAVAGDEPARALIVTSPSGFARLITQAGTPAAEAPTPTDMDLLLRLSAELGDEILGPPAPCPTDEPEIGRFASIRPLQNSL
jgi:quercetin dioxygenase-like cupin family protein